MLHAGHRLKRQYYRSVRFVVPRREGSDERLPEERRVHPVQSTRDILWLIVNWESTTE